MRKLVYVLAVVAIISSGLLSSCTEEVTPSTEIPKKTQPNPGQW